MWVLEKFGRNAPTTAKYPFFKQVDSIGTLHPKKENINQSKWDQAWEWYDVYKNGAIPFLEYRIQIREKELEEEKEDYEDYKTKSKIKRWQKGWVEYYEDLKIETNKLKSELEPLKKQEEQKNRLLDLQEQAAHYGVSTRIIKDAIASKKFYKDNIDLIVEEITKQIDLEKVNNQSPNKEVSQSYLTLENENLRLKKEILEMELKLKNFNKKR